MSGCGLQRCVARFFNREVANAKVNDGCNCDGQPVRNDIPDREEAAEHQDAWKSEAKGIERGCVEELEELDGCRNTCREKGDGKRSPRGKKRRDDPVDHDCPKHRAAVFDDDMRQAKRNKSNRSARNHGHADERQRNCKRSTAHNRRAHRLMESIAQDASARTADTPAPSSAVLSSGGSTSSEKFCSVLILTMDSR